MTKKKVMPLAYHWPSDRYGCGVCGTRGMMAGQFAQVTCNRCKRSPRFLAASNVSGRYEGKKL